MFDRGSPWDGKYHGRSPQEPSQRYLRGTRLMCLRDPVQHVAGNFACPQWEPGNKGNSIGLTIIHHVIPFTVRKAIAILNGDDRDNSARSLDVLLCNVRQRDQANLAFVSNLSQSFHRRLERDDGIRYVQLIHVDAVQTQSLEASLNRLAKVRRSCIVRPLARAGAVPATLGRNHEASWVREQRLGNQFLAYVWTVRVRRINEIDIQFHRSAKNPPRPFANFLRSPKSFPR